MIVGNDAALRKNQRRTSLIQCTSVNETNAERYVGLNDEGKLS